MDPKTYQKIRFQDDQFMRRLRLIDKFKQYGFTVDQNKKHILIHKTATKHSLQEFTLGFPHLDNAIFWMEGYVFYIMSFNEHYKTGDTEVAPDPKATVH